MVNILVRNMNIYYVFKIVILFVYCNFVLYLMIDEILKCYVYEMNYDIFVFLYYFFR